MKKKGSKKDEPDDVVRITLSGEVTLSRQAIQQLLSDDPTSLTPLTADVIVSKSHAQPKNGKRTCRRKGCHNRLNAYNKTGVCHACQSKCP